MRHGGKRVWVSQAVSRQLPFVVDFLGLRRNVVVLSLAIFCVGLGEELWARFLPKYLEALGASVLAIGAFGTLQDLLEGLYPYPGGVLADRWGRKRALVTFNLLALVGYGVYLLSPSWPFVFVGLGFAMAWSWSVRRSTIRIWTAHCAKFSDQELVAHHGPHRSASPTMLTHHRR
jgi:MFS family permease